jgi:molecular chaperone GrpE
MTPPHSDHDNNGTPADLPESPPAAPEGHDGAPEPEPDASAAIAGDEAAPDLDELAARAAKADEYLALAQRTQADFENYRRRASREASLAQERGAVKLAKELLPAVDNLERALAHADSDPTHPDVLVAGVKHVLTDVVGALKRAGIEVFSPEGEPFDPTLHEAVAQQPIEGAEPGTVVEVFQRGYRIGETVVRPARVVVAG